MAATITKGYTFSATEWVTATKLHTLVDSATITGIVNAEVAAAAGIAYSKLALSNSILNADMNASADIALAKIVSGASGSMLLTNAAGELDYQTISGDLTIDASGVGAIAAGVIVNADVNASADIALSKLVSGASGSTLLTNAAGELAYAIISGDFTIDASGVGALSDGVIVNADINASADIALAKMVSGASGSMLITKSDGELDYQTISGDLTIDASGVGAIAAGVIVNADLNASADIALSKLVSAASGSTLLAAANGDLTAVLVSGDFTIAADGTGALEAGVILNADINASADIALSKLVSAASGSALIAAANGEFAAVEITGDVAVGADGTSTAVSATSTTKGISELAIASEVDTGTDAGRTITPDALAGSKIGKKIIELVPFERTSSITSGDGKADLVIPPALNGMNLVYANAAVLTAGSSGATVVMLYNVTDSADMLATGATISSGTTGFGVSGAIATAADDVATGDLLRLDIDSVCTTAEKGLLVTLEFQLP